MTQVLIEQKTIYIERLDVTQGRTKGAPNGGKSQLSKLKRSILLTGRLHCGVSKNPNSDFLFRDHIDLGTRGKSFISNKYSDTGKLSGLVQLLYLTLMISPTTPIASSEPAS